MGAERKSKSPKRTADTDPVSDAASAGQPQLVHPLLFLCPQATKQLALGRMIHFIVVSSTAVYEYQRVTRKLLDAYLGPFADRALAKFIRLFRML